MTLVLDDDVRELTEDATILVTGGTGSFGRQITNELLKYPVREIRIFSRGEDLQHQMARDYRDTRLQFIIGDVRDFERVLDSMYSPMKTDCPAPISLEA